MWKQAQAKLPSPRERLDLLMLGIAGVKPVEELCKEAGVSRTLFYRWMERLKETGLEVLEAQKPGPKKPSGEKQTAQVERLEKQVEHLSKSLAETRKEKQHLEVVLSTAHRIIRRQGWSKAGMDAKKKRKSASSTSSNGAANEPGECGSASTSNAMGSVEPPIGDGRMESTPETGNGQ